MRDDLFKAILAMKKLESQEQETECNDDDPVRVLKYCFIFALAYAALLAVIQFLPIEGGSGVSIGVLLGAVTAAVTVFVKDNQPLWTESP